MYYCFFSLGVSFVSIFVFGGFIRLILVIITIILFILFLSLFVLGYFHKGYTLDDYFKLSEEEKGFA